MGQEGDRHTSMGQQAALDLMHQLAVIPGVSSKKMFGGYGLFHDDKMFGMVNPQGQAYFKVVKGSEARYTQHGAVKHSKMPYFTIPEPVLSNADTLLEWANLAITESK